MRSLLRWSTLAALTVSLSPVGLPAEADDGLPALTGTVVDLSGQPLKGARVDIATAAPKVGRGIFCPSCYLDCSKWDSTDAAGRFKLSELDSTLRFRLLVAMPGYKTLHTDLIDPQSAPVDLQLAPLPTNIDQSLVVAGVVKSGGIPVPGALVKPYGATTPERRWWGRVRDVDVTVTDSEGRFQMLIPETFQSLDIEVTAHGLCGIQVMELPPGRLPVDIVLSEGARVTGSVVHNGAPVAGMSVAVVQLDRTGNSGIFIAAVGDVTDSQGRFEFRNLPPDQRYCIYSVAGEARRSECPLILTVKKLSVPGSGETRDVGPLEATEPVSIRGQVERIDGKPLPENLKLSFGRQPAWDLVSAAVAKDGTFEISGLPPESYIIRLGNRDLVMDGDGIRYQMLSDSSFGIHMRQSVSDLMIPVRGK